MNVLDSNHGRQDVSSIVEDVICALDQEKALDVVCINMHGESAIADYIIIASGRSSKHVVSMGHKLSIELKHIMGRYVAVEGRAQGDWVLVDAGDIVVHIFRPEVREFYKIEQILQKKS